MRALHQVHRPLQSSVLFLVFGALLLGLVGCGEKQAGEGTSQDEAQAPGDSAPGDSAPGDSAPGDSAGTSQSPTAKQEEGASTPKGVIDGLVVAMGNDDFPGLIPYILPEQRAILSLVVGVVPMTFLTGMAEAMLPLASAVNNEELEQAKAKVEAMKSAQEQLLKKYKISDMGMGDVMKAGKDNDALTDLANEAMGHVDHAAFLKDAVALLAKFSDEKSVSKSPFEYLDLSQVTIKEDGDTAVASIPGREQDLKLVRKSGRWYVDLTSMKQ